MATRLITTGTIKVLTFKEGLLSPVAHDLELRLERFEISEVDGKVTATLDPASLRVVGAVRSGRVDPSVLGAKDLREIDKILRGSVLEVARHREIVFSADIDETGAELLARGQLRLHGVSESVILELTRRDGRLVGRVDLVPSRWRIKPFKALLGAIRVQDRVAIELDLPNPD